MLFYVATVVDKMVQKRETAVPEAFDKNTDSLGRRILMDRCPRQNSKKALKALEDVDALVFRLPPAPLILILSRKVDYFVIIQIYKKLIYKYSYKITINDIHCGSFQIMIHRK